VFHRVNSDIIELTLTLCSPSEAANYNTTQAEAVKK